MALSSACYRYYGPSTRFGAEGGRTCQVAVRHLSAADLLTGQQQVNDLPHR
jgi:hypothetical protein